MIYGILDVDPEWGESCITKLSNSLGELLYKIKDYYNISECNIVKSKKYKSWKRCKTDSHPYYPEIEPFLWETKGWDSVDKSKIKQLCIKLNYNYENVKHTNL